MKKIILLLLFLTSLFSYDLKKTDFATFCNYVSYTINKNIVLSADVPTSFSVFMPLDNMTSTELEKSFFVVLKSQGLKYKIIRNTIVVYKNKMDSVKPLLYTKIIPFVFVSPDIISKYIKTYYPNVKFLIFNNRLVITATSNVIKSITFFVSNLMSSYLQARVNFLIIVIDNKKAKSLSSSLSVKNPFKHLLISLVSNSVSFTNNLPPGALFSSFLQFLNSKNVSQTISKPSLLLVDGSNYTLESVHNIPYVQKTVTITRDGNPVTQSQIKYKDVGLKIFVKNVFITKKNIDFDMDIYVQNLVSMENNVPIIDTKHLTTHVQLTKKHSSYLLAGLRTVTKLTNNQSVPVLSRIPFLGLFFQNKKSDIEDLSFALYIKTNFFKGGEK